MAADCCVAVFADFQDRTVGLSFFLLPAVTLVLLSVAATLKSIASCSRSSTSVPSVPSTVSP